jgi:hypothetical protein
MCLIGNKKQQAWVKWNHKIKGKSAKNIEVFESNSIVHKTT